MSLKYRIAATIFALEVLVIGTVLWITLGHSMRTVREQIARTEGVTLQLLADLSRAALLTDEFTDLQTFIEGATRDPRVITIVVSSAEGHVVAGTEPELIGGPFPELVTVREYRYWRTIDIRGGSGVLGTLAIKFSNHPLALAYRETRNLGLSIAIIGMVAIAIVGIAMGFLLTRRLGALAVAADRVAGGELAVRVAPSGSDEVARVGRAFDSMVARLEANMAALQAARDQLIEPTEAMSRLRAVGRRRSAGALQPPISRVAEPAFS
jgi:methyl-accepting chemotaxis protein